MNKARRHSKSLAEETMRKREQQSRSIPTEAEFAAASKKMDERLAKGAKIKKLILSNIPSKIPCHDVWVWLSNPVPGVSFIYPTNFDLEAHEEKGFQAEIDNEIKKVFLKFGISEFSIEYHSHQYVLEKCNGNYDKYFR